MSVRNFFKSTSAILLVALLTACSQSDEQQPQSKKLKWQQSSEQGLYQVSIEPRGSTLPIGEYHEWLITLKDSKGTPVTDARIAISGGMPSHGHGLPTQPVVTDHLGEGQHRIEGMRFNMAGPWVLQYQIASPAGVDRVQFDIEIAF